MKSKNQKNKNKIILNNDNNNTDKDKNIEEISENENEKNMNRPIKSNINSIETLTEENNWLQILEEDLEDFSINSSDDKSEEKDLIKTDNPNEVNISYDKNDTDLNIDININKQKEKLEDKKLNNINKPNTNEIDINTLKMLKNSLYLNEKEFKPFSRYNIYNNKRKIKKIIYKCANIRKDEVLRRATGQSVFCNATIEFIEPGQNVKSGYFFKKFHQKNVKNLILKK